MGGGDKETLGRRQGKARKPCRGTAECYYRRQRQSVEEDAEGRGRKRRVGMFSRYLTFADWVTGRRRRGGRVAVWGRPLVSADWGI